MKRKAFFSVCLTMVFIAGCGFFTYRKRAVQSEARTNLASIATAEIAYYGENGVWGETFNTIGWAPFGENAYAFYLNSCENVIPSNVTGYRECPPQLEAALAECQKSMPTTLTEFCKNCNEEQLKLTAKGFCAAAVANLDHDPKLDIWIINPLKQPTNLLNDSVK